LSAYLEQNGIRCFVAYRDIPRGKDWADFIPPAIENCKIMVYVHSKTANISKMITNEIALCLKYNHPILPFKIQNVDYSGPRAFYLETINWIDAFPNPKEYFGKLFLNIQKLLENDKSNEEKQEKVNQFSRILLNNSFINLLRKEVIRQVTENQYLLHKIDFNKYITIESWNKAHIEGAITACICFFEIYDKTRIWGKVDNDMANRIISFMGMHYLTTQKEIVEKKFESYKAIYKAMLKLWNGWPYNEIPEEIIDILNNYCSYSDNDFFYDGWLNFSVLSFMESDIAVVQNKGVHLTISCFVSALNEYLNFYVQRTNHEGYLFWATVEYFIRYKLNFVDKNAQYLIQAFDETDKKYDTISWKENVWKELELNNDIINQWKKRFNDFEYDKETGILIILNEQKLNLYH